jgi:hypothetical protein
MNTSEFKNENDMIQKTLLPFNSSYSILFSVKGNVLSKTEFKNWIKQAELLPTVSLAEIENKWTSIRIKLQKLI